MFMVLTSVTRRFRTNCPLFLLLLILFSNRSMGQFAKYSNEFLNIGAGARGMSMGNAQVASVTDGTAGYWNPAALANVTYQSSIEFNARGIFCRYWKI